MKHLSGILVFCLTVVALSIFTALTATTHAQQEPSLTSCTFVKGDQNPQALPYKSPILLGYFDEVAEKTGVPPALLAAFARVEATTKQYSISNYTDDEIQQMNNGLVTLETIDDKIDGVKALCPVSEAAALGIMQVTPPRDMANAIIEELKKTRPRCTDDVRAEGTPCWSSPGGSPKSGIALGAQFAGKDPDSITVQDFCDPKTSIYLAAGVIIKKMFEKEQYPGSDGRTWNPVWNNDKGAFDAAADGYYGCVLYPNCNLGPNSYGDDLWNSYQSCINAKAGKPSTLRYATKSNIVSTLVKNDMPLPSQQPTPPTTAGNSCVTAASYVPFKSSYAEIQQGQFSYVCGHCRPIYNANDVGVGSEGGTPVLAVTSGTVQDISNPVGGPALWLVGDDGRNYYYAHLRRSSFVTGRVSTGQQIGTIAAASENPIAKNNGIAHVHISAGTPGNQQSFDDPANIPMGPLLDQWCNVGVCNGKPNSAYACGG